MAKDTFYFQHDYNTRTDSKIKKLIAKHGFAGYGIFWAIVEELYNNNNNLPTDYELLLTDRKAKREVVRSVVEDFDLFLISDAHFGSTSIENRLNDRNEKSRKAKESANNRWKQTNDDANALRTHDDRNAIKERKERKGDKGKEREETVASASDENILPPDDLKNSLLQFVQKNIRKFYPQEFAKAKAEIQTYCEKHDITQDKINTDAEAKKKYDAEDERIYNRYLKFPILLEIENCYLHYSKQNFKINGEEIKNWFPVLAGWMNRRVEFSINKRKAS